jgi:hypothetical protein
MIISNQKYSPLERLLSVLVFLEISLLFITLKIKHSTLKPLKNLKKLGDRLRDTLRSLRALF